MNWTIEWTVMTSNPVLGDLLPQSCQRCYAAARHSEIRAWAYEDRLEEERAVVREMLRQHGSRQEQVSAWTRRTGKSKRAFRRRLTAIGNR